MSALFLITPSSSSQTSQSGASGSVPARPGFTRTLNEITGALFSFSISQFLCCILGLIETKSIITCRLSRTSMLLHYVGFRLEQFCRVLVSLVSFEIILTIGKPQVAWRAKSQTESNN